MFVQDGTETLDYIEQITLHQTNRNRYGVMALRTRKLVTWAMASSRRRFGAKQLLPIAGE